MMITTGLSTFFDRRPWTAEKIRFFAQAIEDLDYDLARRAAEKYMREGEFAPVPRDIREIASKLEPVRKLIDGPLDHDGLPKRYHRDGDGCVRTTREERRTLDRQYARMARETQTELARRRERDGKRSPNNARVELQAVLDRFANKATEWTPF